MKYLILLLLSFPAFADPTHRFDGGSQSVTIYDDPCNSKTVTNLPVKAVLIEDGVAYEGCAGEASWGPVILLFIDKKGTVGALPASVFKAIKSI